jgi:hypothetical protein
MKTTMAALLLFCLALTGCVVEPGGSYGDRGWGNGGHVEFHSDQRRWDH